MPGSPKAEGFAGVGMAALVLHAGRASNLRFRDSVKVFLRGHREDLNPFFEEIA